MSGIDTFGIVMICVGSGIAVGCVGTYIIFCCSYVCMSKNRKDESNLPSNLNEQTMFENPGFHRNLSVKPESRDPEDPLPP